MKPISFFLVMLMMTILSNNISSAQVNVAGLRCEYLTNPLGIDVALPRLSWILESHQRGVMQTGYEILVASSPDQLKENHGDLWESGKISSDQSSQIVYAGKPLVTRTTCYWKVRVWDNHGTTSPFSEPAMWRMGLLSGSDWKAKWIGLKTDTSSDPQPAPYVRKEFVVKKTVKSAYVYATARGLFIASLNGARIGADQLSPEWSDYGKRIQYFTYDVTHQLKEGMNCFGIMIGDGWYKGYVGFIKHPHNYGIQTSALLQLDIEYSDGTEETVCTDGTWKGSFGPILYSDLLMGEYYDAQREMEGWDKAGFNEKNWRSVEVMEPPSASLVALRTEPVRITRVLKPLKITEPTKGTLVYDLGQNMAGFVQLKVRGARGTQVKLRHAEVLNPDGTIYATNLRRAKATDTYTLKGGGEEIYQPHFTFHGFRYVEVTHTPEDTKVDLDLAGCAINSDLALTGTFECSDPVVNQLQSNILWSQRGNFISIPTDCPQRDERMGWMGDAQIFVRTASFNMDIASFMTKWMYDVVDGQSPAGAFKDTSPYIKGGGSDGAPGWGDAGVIVPYYIYRCYGDTRIIEENFEPMQKWMRYIAEANPDFLRKNHLNNNYGDWLSIKAETPKDMLATAFWAHDAMLMSEMAKAIGRTSDQQTYLSLFNSVKSAFQKAYIKDDGRVFGETQTGYVLALAFDLMPENLRQQAAQYLVDNIKAHETHLSTGFIGVKYLNPVLTSNGYLDVAYKLLFNKTFPSWGFPVTQGATTIWERWDGWTPDKGFQDPGMNSFNHYSMGSVGEWLYRFVAGIDVSSSAVGFKQIVIHPQPNAGLSFARADYQSVHGMIKSGWKREGGELKLSVEIPANATATVYVPTFDPTTVREGGLSATSSPGVKHIRNENGCAVFAVGSGKYEFESSWK